MADVVIDAMVAEAARQERAAYAGDLQSLSWLAMAIGGIAGSLIGGYALSNLRIHMIYLLFSIFPTVQLFACSLVEEKSSSSFRTVEQVNTGVTNEQAPPDMPKSILEKSDEKGDGGESEFSPQVSTDCLEEQVMRDDEDWVKIQKKKSGEIVEEINERMQDETSTKGEISVSEDKHSLLDIHKVDGMRRRKKPDGIEGEKKVSEAESKRVDHQDRREKQWLLNVKSTYSTLIQAMRQPIILRPMLWFFLAQVTIPNISTVMFYYQTDVLHLDASFLGAARVVGWGGLMLGTFIYNHYLKRVPLRNIFLGTHISLSFLTFLDVILVSRVNVSLGISDKAFVICSSALADAVNQFKLMPFLVLSGRLCPPGIEGTLFALFMSINNFGGTVSSFFGAVLASALHISSDRFDNLALGIYVQAVCTLIPVCFLFLIPKKATGSSSQE
ncbi:probable folate-biopterin transporter 4 isoform X2 [Cryptomeria japonica]|nr:probable folate-biopterin transporter 4 isoform X2 [Cryptomeria japonica]